MSFALAWAALRATPSCILELQTNQITFSELEVRNNRFVTTSTQIHPLPTPAYASIIYTPAFLRHTIDKLIPTSLRGSFKVIISVPNAPSLPYLLCTQLIALLNSLGISPYEIITTSLPTSFSSTQLANTGCLLTPPQAQKQWNLVCTQTWRLFLATLCVLTSLTAGHFLLLSHPKLEPKRPVLMKKMKKIKKNMVPKELLATIACLLSKNSVLSMLKYPALTLQITSQEPKGEHRLLPTLQELFPDHCLSQNTPLFQLGSPSMYMTTITATSTQNETFQNEAKDNTCARRIPSIVSPHDSQN